MSIELVAAVSLIRAENSIAESTRVAIIIIVSCIVYSVWYSLYIHIYSRGWCIESKRLGHGRRSHHRRRRRPLPLPLYYSSLEFNGPLQEPVKM